MRKLLCAAFFVLSIIQAIGCGGSGRTVASGSPSPTPLPTPAPTPVSTPAASGEYLFEGNSLFSLNLSQIDTATGALGPTTLAAISSNNILPYPGVAVTPSKKFLYSFFASFSEIQGFAISGPQFVLAPLKNTPFTPHFLGSVDSMALHPTGSFLYVVQSFSTIEEQSVNPVTGDLTFVSDTSEQADLRMPVIEPAGKFLYVIELTGSRIFAYRINQTDGMLSTLAGSPFALPAGSHPSIGVTDSSGKFLYVTLSAGGVAAFAIDSSSGTLTAVPGSPFSTSSDPVFLAAHPAGNFVYVCNSNGSIDGFAADTTTGSLTPVAGSPFATTAGAPGNIAIDPLGKFLYVSSRLSSTIHGLSINATSGALSALPGSPFPAVDQVQNLFILKIP
jgi:6-phosphogluconolactonase (cycloisomerase 2 family)